MGTAILRMATKKALEAAARKENDDLGSAISIVNALTEKADTRNWQTLPYQIAYTRVSLPEGENTVDFKMTSSTVTAKTQTLKFNISKGKTTFFTFSSLDSFAPADN
jgi:hypothetical protein